MKIKGYVMTSKYFDKVLKRVKELNKKYYTYRNYIPVYIIKFNKDYDDYTKDENAIIFSCEEDIMTTYLLGYGFDGLIEDEDKVKEIEEFGKYRCYLKYFDTEIPDDIINIEKIIE